MKKLSLLFMCALMCMYASGRTIDLTSLPASGSTYGMKSFIDGDTITGTLRGQLYPYQLFIANNATIYLKNVTIYGYDDARYPFAGLTCNGNAHIVLIGSNFVQGFYHDYPGIQASTTSNRTLRISGNGSLDVRCGGTENPNTGVLQGYAAAIGGSFNDNCGDIVIEGGTINAYSGSASAAIGAGSYHECGMITISGGNITTHPGSNNSTGIGASFHGECDKITISGGTIYAEGNGHGAAIGGNEQSTTYGIEITSGLVYITALNESYNPKTGFGAPYTIGKGLNGTGSTVTIAGISLGDGIAENPFVYPQPCTAPTNVNVTNVTKNSAKIAWTSASIIDSKWDIAYKADGDLGETHKIVTTNPYTLTGLSEGKDYTVRVRTACGTSSYSNYSSNVSFSTPCPIPTNLRVPAATITSSTASVNWDGTSDKYFIEWGIVGETTTKGMVVTAKNTLLSELQPSTNYRVRVKGKCSESNFSDNTSWVNFTTSEYVNPCAAPRSFQTGNITQTSARISWTKGSASQNTWVVSYKKAGESSYYDHMIYNNYVNLNDLTPGTEYDVKIVAKCSDNQTSEPLTGSFTTLPGECNYPSNMGIVGQAGSHSLTLTWFPESSATRWRIKWNKKGEFDYEGYANVYMIPYTIENLASNLEYEVQILSRCTETQLSDYSPSYFFRTAADPFSNCNKPANLRVSNLTTTSAKVTWAPGGSEENWLVEMYQADDPSGRSYSKRSTTEDTFRNLLPETEYVVKVQAKCSEDTYSDDAVIRFTTPSTTEGIEEITPSDSPTRGEKILRDGQLLILVGDKTYDARGVEIKK